MGQAQEIAQHLPSRRVTRYFASAPILLGTARNLWQTDKMALAVGGDFTFLSKPSILDEVYGDHPVAWKLFVRVRPGKMNMSSHATGGATH